MVCCLVISRVGLYWLLCVWCISLVLVELMVGSIFIVKFGSSGDIVF